ncbi:MAG: NIPSNAP family protein [Maricaulaceae bacterium]
MTLFHTKVAAARRVLIRQLTAVLAAAAFIAAAGCASLPGQAEPTSDMRDWVYELRVYTAAEGRLDDLSARFRDHTLEIFERHGMTSIGYWTPLDETDERLFYILAFPSREARDAAWQAFGDDPEWEQVAAASNANGRILAGVESTFLTLTDYSPELEIVQPPRTRVFELRTYTTNEGKLDDLHERFADHTIMLFRRHGMNNVAYFSLMDDQEGAANTLVYLLAHADPATRNASFRAFSQDAEWQRVAEESNARGPILVEGGVDSVMLEPTDYSPLK